MRKILFFVFLVFSKAISACDCPPFEVVSASVCSNYNVVFYGKVDSVSVSNGYNTAYFTIQELYKGKVKQHVKINFDATTACMMSFSKNEEWLMYCSFQRFDDLAVNFCGHSRKYFSNTSQDFYQLAAQRTFEEEKLFLRSNLLIQPFVENDKFNQQQVDFKPHNNQPSGFNKLLLLLTSFLVMIIIYIVTRKKNKKND
jgi:hypothetical protein